MHPRHNITERFSTFLQFEADQVSSWATDPQLRRSIRACLAQLPQSETSEDFLVAYWYKIWQTQPESLAKEHLSAYLQEPCYWAARRITDNFASPQYSLSDCFQLAITRVEDVLNRFNPQRGILLKTYATRAFAGLIRDALRQHREAQFCTDWALLHRLSQKRLVESLQTAGLASEIISRYLLGWKSFNAIYVRIRSTETRRLPRFDSSSWEAIAELYNAQRYQQPDLSEPVGSAKTLEAWMRICAQSVRSYLYPNPAQVPGKSLDRLPSSQPEPLARLINREEEQKQAQINAVLVGALTMLTLPAQRMLQLYYGKRQSQPQIANQLGLNQATISRHLHAARQSLLRALAQWSQEVLHNSFSSNRPDLNARLEEWLYTHYKQQLSPGPQNPMGYVSAMPKCINPQGKCTPDSFTPGIGRLVLSIEQPGSCPAAACRAS